MAAACARAPVPGTSSIPATASRCRSSAKSSCSRVRSSDDPRAATPRDGGVDADVVVLGGRARPGSAPPTAWRGAADGSCVARTRSARRRARRRSFEVAGPARRPRQPPPAPFDARADHGDVARAARHDLQRRPRHGRIRMAGRFVAFPPRPADLVRQLPPALSARLARDMATSPFRTHARPTRSPRSCAASLGPTMADRFYAPYVEKLFGVPATELAGELARRRVGASSGVALVRRVVRPDPDRGVFFYPRRGYGQISEALADAATARRRRDPHRVPRSLASSRRRRVEVRTGDGGRSRAAMVWSTLPLGVARPARRRRPHDVLAAAARARNARASCSCTSRSRHAQWTPFDAHYFPEPTCRSAASRSRRTTATAPTIPRDVTVLCAEIPCALGDALLERDSRRARRPSARRARPQRPPDSGTDRRRRCAACRACIPCTASASSSRSRRSTRGRRRYPTVLHFGRQGLFAHDNTHHALGDGVGGGRRSPTVAPSTSERGTGPAPSSRLTSSRTEPLSVELVDRAGDSTFARARRALRR